MLRGLPVAVTLLAILVGVGACAGKTVVLDSPAPTGPAATHADAPTGPPAPEQAPEPTASSSAGGDEPAEPGEDTGWWPPAPDPARSTPADPTPTPSPEDTDEGEPTEEPAQEEEPERFTFPGWEEYIYDSRNGERPEQFRNRERFVSCGDYASEAGAHVISPEVAACLDEGRRSPGKESAIAVRMGEGGVHVWFVRVGPGTAEYYVDRTPAGGGWLHATCDAGTSIGVLDCQEPVPVHDEGEEEETQQRPSQEDPSEQAEDAGEEEEQAEADAA